MLLKVEPLFCIHCCTQLYLCSGADVYAEDHMLCTPVLIAAAFNNFRAFRCLLGFMDLKSAEKNPIFTALHVKMHRAEILNVRLQIYLHQQAHFTCSVNKVYVSIPTVSYQ